MYITKSKGPRTEPCGTPYDISRVDDLHRYCEGVKMTDKKIFWKVPSGLGRINVLNVSEGYCGPTDPRDPLYLDGSWRAQGGHVMTVILFQLNAILRRLTDESLIENDWIDDRRVGSWQGVQLVLRWRDETGR